MRHMRWVNAALQLMLFAAALALYLHTLNPDVQPADSGEFQIAALTLGIPHPPGYPLYTMLGWLVSRIPVGSPYARISFLSALAAAATLVLVSVTVQLLVASGERGRKANSAADCSWAPVAAGIIAAVALGTSTTFWSQATTTNVRSLTAFFTALMVFAAVQVYAAIRTQPRDLATVRRYLIIFAVASGLGVGHHVSLVFTSAVLSVFLLALFVRARLSAGMLIGALLALIATQLVWLYLPLRDAAGARFAPGNLTTLSGLLYHIFARGFAGDMLAFAAPQFLSDRLAVVPTLLLFEFSAAVLIATLAGLALLLWKRQVFVAVLLTAIAIHGFITITYRAPQTVEYAIPVWVMMGILFGAGLAELAAVAASLVKHLPDNARLMALRRILPAAMATLLLLLGGYMVIADAAGRLSSFDQLRQDRSTRTHAAGALNAAAPGSVILAQWHQATPMWALQDIEGLRRDVKVEYVYPRGAQPYADTFAEQAAASAQAAPTYVTSVFAVPYQTRGLVATPVGNLALWVIDSGSAQRHTSAVNALAVFDQRIAVLGVTVTKKTAQAGQSAPIVLAWTALRPVQDGESLTVRVMRNDGRLAANADVRLDPGQPVGAQRTVRLSLGIPLDLQPGNYRVLVGAYRAGAAGLVELKDGAGVDFTPVSEVRIALSSTPAVSMHPLSVGLSDGAWLTGIDYDTGIADKLRLLTHWQSGAHPLTVTVQNAGGQALAAPAVLPAATDGPGYFTLIFDMPPARQVHLAIDRQAGRISVPDATAGERYVPFSDQMILVGSSIQHIGSQLKVDLQWLSARPLTHDDIVSVRLQGNAYRSAHDGEPALGALPTLKWIAGSLVTDRHPFDLGGYEGALRGSVVVYDAFTEEPLPPLDERYENLISFAVN